MNQESGKPPTVVVLTEDSTVPEPLEDGLAARPSASVAVVDDADSLADALETRDRVGCVVIADATTDTPAVVERCRATDPDLPVVVSADPVTDVSDVTRFGTARLYRESEAETSLAGYVLDALEDWDRRRTLRADATMMRSYFENVRHALWALDAEGRFHRTSRTPAGLGPADVIGNADGPSAGGSDPEYVLDDIDRRVLSEGDADYCRDQPVETKSSTQWFRTTRLPGTTRTGRSGACSASRGT